MMMRTVTLFFLFYVCLTFHVDGKCLSNGIFCIDTTWESNGKTVAGGHGGGDALNQLNSSYGLFVNSDNVLFISDYFNHRVIKWNPDASSGTVVAGGQCGPIDQGQLCLPTAMIFNKEGTMFVTAEDGRNGSVIRWKKDATSGETIIMTNTSLYGIALDAEEKYLYVVHHREHRVLKYTIDGEYDSVVAGGNGQGKDYDQLDYPRGVAVDKSGSVYVSDSRNHRVVRWDVNATEGVVVAGGNGNGSQIDQLTVPGGIVLDKDGTIYVVDEENQRVVSVGKGTGNGTIIAGGNGEGDAANQLDYPISLTFNGQGDLYVSDFRNFRVQMFPITKPPPSGSPSHYFDNSFNKWVFIYSLLSLIISVTF